MGSPLQITSSNVSGTHFIGMIFFFNRKDGRLTLGGRLTPAIVVIRQWAGSGGGESREELIKLGESASQMSNKKMPQVININVLL